MKYMVHAPACLVIINCRQVDDFCPVAMAIVVNQLYMYGAVGLSWKEAATGVQPVHLVPPRLPE